MSHYLSGIIKIILIEAMLALLIVDRLTATKYGREKTFAATGLSALMLFAWCNYGQLRGTGAIGYVLLLVPLCWCAHTLFSTAFSGASGSERNQRLASLLEAVGRPFRFEKSRSTQLGAVTVSAVLLLGFLLIGQANRSIEMVHPWEQFHFYLGAKYQSEVGWFDLYKATVLVDQESVKRLGSIEKIRAIETFEEIPLADALRDSARVRSKFSDQRWESFKKDWATMTQTWSLNWGAALLDHGNSNSPAWALLAAPLTALFPLSAQNQSWLGWIDMLLMIILWLTIFQCFDTKQAAVGLFFWATPPLVFDYLSGSLLRWDWLFALGMAACCLKKNRWALAGAFFGYAMTTKLFPLFFGLALLVPVFKSWRTTRLVAPEWKRFFVSTALASVLLVGVSTAVFGHRAWLEYAARIQVAQQEKFYSIQYSLKTVYLQVAETPLREWVTNPLFPRDLKQALPEVDIANHSVPFLLIRLFFTALVVVLLWRSSTVEAFLFGPALVFIWLTVNMYYWNMLGLMALGLTLREDKRPLSLLLGLGSTFIFFYLYQHTNRGLYEGYVVATLFAAGLLVAAVAEFRSLRQKSATG